MRPSRKYFYVIYRNGKEVNAIIISCMNVCNKLLLLDFDSGIEARTKDDQYSARLGIVSLLTPPVPTVFTDSFRECRHFTNFACFQKIIKNSNKGATTLKISPCIDENMLFLMATLPLR